VRIAWDNPWWLLLALLAIPLAVVALRAFTSMTRLRRGSAAVARLALLALLAAALAGASGVRETDRLAVVVVADLSASAVRYGRGPDGSTGAVDSVRSFLARAQEGRGAEDLLGVVAFGRTVSPVATPSASAVADRPLPTVDGSGTDIAAALRTAAAMVPPDSAGRIVLISDGNETVGDALEAGRRLARGRRLGEGVRGGLPIDVVPLAYDVRREVVVEFVDAPPTASAGAIVPVRVGLRAVAPAAGSLRVLVDGEQADANGSEPGLARRVLLDAGRTVEVVQVPLPEGRVHRFEAVFEPERRDGVLADTALENNSGRAFTLTPREGAVLLVTGVGAGAGDRPLALALRDAGLRVERRQPQAVPADLVALEAYDLVILEGVGADELPQDAQRTLASYVTRMGGGLVMVGGEGSFGSGGWRGSVLEPILPVHLDLPQRVRTPQLAIAIVLDNSGSMRRGVLGSARSQQAIANEAAAIAVSSLDTSDRVCVIAFNNATQVVVPMGPNTDPARSASAVRAIASGGGTRIGPAMRLARQKLDGVEARVKHMIVLSDGRSTDAEVLPELARQANQGGVTVSTIAVGDSADLETMQQIADAAGGTYYHVINPNVLPRVFLKEVRVTRTPLVRTGSITPVVLPAPSPATVGLGQPPALGGVNLTRPRDNPQVTLAMATRRGEPLLAHWNAGVGRVAAFTSDAQRWASDWLDWPGFERFWAQLANAMARSVEDSPMRIQAAHDDGAIRVSLRADDDQGAPIDLLDVELTVFAPGGQARTARLAQVGPGQYEATVPADTPGSYVVLARPKAADRALQPLLAGVSVSGGRELRDLASNTQLLEALADQTGGRVLGLESAGRVFDRADIGPVRARTPLWRTLLAWALAVLVLDVGTRRVAWDRLVSAAFGADWLRATQQLSRRGADAGRAVATLRAAGGAGHRGAADDRPRRDSQADAQRVAYEVQQRILRSRADRAASRDRRPQGEPDQPAAGTAPPPAQRDDAATPAEAPAESGLRAAKARARERIERGRADAD